MSKNLADPKSCGTPQPLPTAQPSNEWLPEQLKTYAQAQYRQIIDGESYLTPPYWRLGHALVLAKKTFTHGQWTHYLEELGIDKTRASKARAIYRTFTGEEDVAGLTVEEAYARRRRKKPRATPGSASDAAGPQRNSRSLRTSVGSISKRTAAVIHDAAFVAPEEATILIPAVRKAIHELQELLGALEQQAAASSSDSGPKLAASQTPSKGTTASPT